MYLSHDDNKYLVYITISCSAVTNYFILLEKISSCSTYHCVQRVRSMPVRAFVVRIAVRIKTWGSSRGLAPSREGDQGPPMAMVSFFPLSPTKKWISLVGWTKPSCTSGGSSAKAQDLWYKSSKLGHDINITCNVPVQACFTVFFFLLNLDLPVCNNYEATRLVLVQKICLEWVYIVYRDLNH